MWVTLFEIADWIIIAFTFVVSVGVALSPNVRKYLLGWYANHIAGALDSILPVVASLAPGLAKIVQEIEQGVLTYGPQLQSLVKNDAGKLASSIFTEAEAGLLSGGLSTPDNAVDRAGTALADAFGFGIAGGVTTAAFEAMLPEKLNTLNGVGPMLAKMAGFDEVAAAIRDPLYEAAFGKSAEYHYRSVFKPELPSEDDAVRWHSQGLLTDDQLRGLFNYSGLKAEYEQPFIDSAYRAVNPRMLSNMYQDMPFPFDDVSDMMTFAGIRLKDQERLIKAFEWNSVKNFRNTYVASIIQAWERGDITDDEGINDLAALGFTNEAIGLVQQTVANRKLVQLSELYRKSIDEAYQYGLITDADYIPQLEAIGIAAADAEAHYQLAAFKKQGKALAAEERALAAATKALIRSTSNAAIADFQAGSIDATELAALLASAGMAPLLIPSVVSFQIARQNGRLRLTFGKLLKPADAAILRSQVADVLERVVKKIVAPQQALVVLEGLGLEQTTAAPLIGKAAAQAGISWP